MPQVVDRHRLRDLVTETALLGPVKSARRAAGPVRLAQIRAGAPVGKKQVGLPTAIAGLLKAWPQQAREDDGALLPRLRHVHHNLVIDLGCGSAHMDALPLQINVSGLQAHQLAPTQSTQAEREHNGPSPIGGGRPRKKERITTQRPRPPAYRERQGLAVISFS